MKAESFVYDGKTIPEMAAEAARKSMRHLTGKDGRLNASGRKMARLLEEIMPSDKVDEWGWDLSRKERAAIKRRAAEEKARKAAAAKARAQKAAATRAKNKAEAVVKAVEAAAKAAEDAAAKGPDWRHLPPDQLPFEEEGKYNTFFEIVDAYRNQLKTFKANGCDMRLFLPLVREVQARTGVWHRRCHPEHVQYFFYQFSEWCRDAMLEREPREKDRQILLENWNSFLTPRVRPPWECPMNAPMPKWPKW